MPEFLIPSGLAVDWLKRLHKAWSAARTNRRQELLEIQNEFGDPDHLAKLYVEPDCQHTNPADFDEDEPGRAIRQPMREWINQFLKGEFHQRDGRNTVFILSDTGMGKTSLLMMLKLTHLLRFWPDGLDFRLLKLGPETLGKLNGILSKGKTVLLLDALDEDPSAVGRIEERLTELLRATQSFRQVFLTCRSQFFPEGNAAPIEKLGKVEIGGFVCNLLYLSPFSDEQVELYLSKVYPDSWRDVLRSRFLRKRNGLKEEAWDVVGAMRSLRMRPMLLAHIDELLKANVTSWSEYRVYDALVRSWLLREQRKPGARVTETQLWKACQAVAVYLQKNKRRVLSPEDLSNLLKDHPDARRIEALDLGGRSLLNRASDGGYRFSHYSIQEFLVAHDLVRGRVGSNPDRSIHATDQLISFLFSWLGESFPGRLQLIRWREMELTGVQSVRFPFPLARLLGEGIDLQGAYLRSADLSEAKLEQANLQHACLEDANLEGAHLAGANLRGADLSRAQLRNARMAYFDGRAANFQGADLRGADLSSSRLVSADFTGANLAGAQFAGAALRGIQGTDFSNSEPGSLRITPRPSGPWSPTCVAWSWSATILAGFSDGFVRVIHPYLGIPILEVGTSSVEIVAIEGNPSRPLFAVCSKHGQLYLCSGDSGEVIESIKLPDTATDLAWSLAGDRLAVLTFDGTLLIWELNDRGKLSQRSKELFKGTGIARLRWRPGARLFVAWLSDGLTVKLQESSDRGGASQKSFTTSAKVTGIALADKVMAVCAGLRIDLWNFETGECESLPQARPQAMKWDSSGRYLALQYERKVIVFDQETKEFRPLYESMETVADISWSTPSNSLFAVCTSLGSIEAVAVKRARRIARLRPEETLRVESAEWSPGGTFLAWSDGDSRTKISALRGYLGSSDTIAASAMRWSPRGNCCAVLSKESGQLALVSPGRIHMIEREVRCMAWSPSDRLAFSRRQRITLRDIKSGLQSDLESSDEAQALAFHPFRELLAVLDVQNKVEVIDVEKGIVRYVLPAVHRFDTGPGRREVVDAEAGIVKHRVPVLHRRAAGPGRREMRLPRLEWSRAGDFLAVFDGCGQFSIWKVEKEALMTSSFFEGVPITAMAWSRDYRFLATGFVNGDLFLMEIGTGQTTKAMRFLSQIVALRWGTHSMNLAVCTGQGEIYFENLADGKLKEVGRTAIGSSLFTLGQGFLDGYGEELKSVFWVDGSGGIYSSEDLPERHVPERIADFIGQFTGEAAGEEVRSWKPISEDLVFEDLDGWAEGKQPDDSPSAS